MIKCIRLTTILFSAIALSPLMAHLFELRVKIKLPMENYRTVQGIYSGWQWLGIFEIGSIFLTLIWLILERKAKPIYPFLLLALICFVSSLVIFFVFTFPANQATNNWTRLPSNWMDLRNTWEYSHAIRAALSFVGFSLLVSALAKNH